MLTDWGLGRRKKLAAIAGLVSLGFSFTGLADPIPPSELPAAAAKAQPGEVIFITDGVYRDLELELSAKGEPENPVVIRPVTPGGVVFSGQSSIELNGEHVVFTGFFFKDGYAPEKAAVALEGSHLRLSEIVIDSYNPPDPKREDKWVTLRGTHHMVDSCTFRNKTSAGVTLTVWRDGEEADHHTIANNHFHTRPKGAESNGYETIRIGTSDTADSHSRTRVTGNLFDSCDGEMEVISVKSGQNIIDGNTFNQCAGTVTLRHGEASKVANNFFTGRNKKETGGVRVYGANHVISGNVFIGTTGRGGGAIALMAGNPDPKPEEFQRAEKIVIDSNLFAANVGPAIKLDEQYRAGNRTLLPKGITVRRNTLTGDDLPSLIAGAEHPELEMAWENTNQLFRDNQIPEEITRNLPRPLYREQVGAPWYRDQLP